jgi:Domain of unknown function (DUF4149)
MLGRINPSVVQVGVLALWLGAAALLSICVAPALFAVLPSRSLAGAVVGRILPPVFYAGMTVGLLVLALQVVQGRGWSWGGREISGIVMIVACAIAQFGVGPRIARLREEIGGPIEELAVDDARRVAFGRLHGFSVAWLGLAMLAAVVAAIVAARASSTDAAG